MSLNMPNTKALIFRKMEKLAKDLNMDVTFKFRGDFLHMVQEEKYLGLVMHAWKGITFSAEQRAVAMNRSLRSMLQRCKQTGLLSQPAFMCEVFEVTSGRLWCGCVGPKHVPKVSV